MPPAAGVMLKQEELALLMAISSVQGNPALLRELRKALAAKNTAKAAACTKAKTSCMALSKRHATITRARSVPPLSPRKGPQPATGKRKAESSGSDGLTTQAARRPAPTHRTPLVPRHHRAAGNKETRQVSQRTLR